MDFHKRCAFLLPNDCSRARRQVSTSLSLFPPRRPRTHSLSNQAGGSLEEVSEGSLRLKHKQLPAPLMTSPVCTPPDQHVQALLEALLQASILGGASSLAGSRVRRTEQGSGSAHLPHPQLHQTHHLPVLPPATERTLQAGAAVFR